MSKVAALQLQARFKREMQIVKTIEVLKQIAVQEFQSMVRQKGQVCRSTRDLETFFQFYRMANVDGMQLFGKPSPVNALVAITSDEGFAGALNSQIIEKTTELFEASPTSVVVAIGRRGARRLMDRGIPIAREFPGISLPLEHPQTMPLRNYLLSERLDGRIGGAKIIHARCESFTRQELAVEELLPFSIERVERWEENPRFQKGYVILEPDAKSIIEYTVALWFGRKLYEIFWDSKLSEAAARAIELNERSEKLQRSNSQTRLRFFRAKHELIDQGIREVFSGQFFAKKLRQKVEA